MDADTPLHADTVGLLEGICTTRAIRRYLHEPVPEDVLRDVMFAATRAPSGSNRQPFRFLVLTDGPKATEAKALIAAAARRAWGTKRTSDGYDQGSGAQDDRSPKAAMARTMELYVEHLDSCTGPHTGLPHPLPRSPSHRRGLDLPGVPEPSTGRPGPRVRGRDDIVEPLRRTGTAVAARDPG